MTTTPQGGRVGIVVAMPSEARALGVRVSVNRVIEFRHVALVYVCGIGPDNARRAARELVTAGIGSAVSWGVAGGLTAKVLPGELLLPHTVVGDDAAWETDAAWRERLSRGLDAQVVVRHDAIYSSGRVVNTAAEKQRLAGDTGAVAVDMESAAIAETAADAGLPFACVRVIADPVTMTLPESLGESIDANGFVSVIRCLGLMLRRPGDIAAMLQVAAHFRRATGTLAVVARQAGPGLLAP